jgi:hypothetical protein
MIGFSDSAHARLHQCNECLAFWEELERFAHQIDDTEAHSLMDRSDFRPVADVIVKGSASGAP